MTKILFVDDEINLRKLVSYDLKQAGFDFSICENGEEALDMVRKHKYDLCIIDWMMPKLSGLELVKLMRKEGNDAILIMLTAKDDEEDLIDAFEAGVDDYVRKPFSSRELILRINAHLKRLKLTQTTTKVLGDVQLDLAKRTSFIKDEAVLLTKIEYDLLLYFMENASKVLSRDMILNELWNF